MSVVATILKAKPKTSATNGRPYMVLWWESKGEKKFAVCWHKKLFERFSASVGGDPLTFYVEKSKDTDVDGNPFLNVDSIEHPGQQDMFATTKETPNQKGEGE